MIYLYDLIDKIDNRKTAIVVDNMHDAIMIEPEGSKDVILKHFDNCQVDSIVIAYSVVNCWPHTHIYVSGEYKE